MILEAHLSPSSPALPSLAAIVAVVVVGGRSVLVIDTLAAAALALATLLPERPLSAVLALGALRADGVVAVMHLAVDKVLKSSAARAGNLLADGAVNVISMLARLPWVMYEWDGCA